MYSKWVISSLTFALSSASKPKITHNALLLGFLTSVVAKFLTCYLYCCYRQAILETTTIVKVPHNCFNARPCIYDST